MFTIKMLRRVAVIILIVFIGRSLFYMPKLSPLKFDKLYIFTSSNFDDYTTHSTETTQENHKSSYLNNVVTDNSEHDTSSRIPVHNKWPPTSVNELWDPKNRYYDLALQPLVEQTTPPWIERYYQLLTVLKTLPTVNGSEVYRAVQIENQLRINPGSFNYNLYPQLIDVEEAVQAIRAGKPVKQRPINNPSLQLLAWPTKVCSPNSHASNQNDTAKYELIVLIKSCVRCKKQRKKSRNTFMQSHLWKDFRIQFAFVTGVPSQNYTGKFHFDGINIEHQSHNNAKTNANETKCELEEESAKYEDLLIGNFDDHYFSLPIKQLFTFRWISAFCRAESNLFLFLDSDFSVIPHNLIRFVRNIPEKIRPDISAGILGQNQRVVRPISKDGRANKWSVSENEIPWPTYAPYFAGAAYILGLEAITDFAVALSFLPPLRIDDSNLGLVLFKLHKQAYGLSHFVHGVRSAAELNQVTCVGNSYTDRYMDWTTGKINATR